MSIEALNWAWKQCEHIGSPSHRLVLLALADAANEDGQCWPRQAVLAKKTGVTKSNVSRAISELQAMALLRVERQGTRNNTYWLDLNRWASEAAREHLDEEDGAAASATEPETGAGDTPDTPTQIGANPAPIEQGIGAISAPIDEANRCQISTSIGAKSASLYNPNKNPKNNPPSLNLTAGTASVHGEGGNAPPEDGSPGPSAPKGATADTATGKPARLPSKPSTLAAWLPAYYVAALMPGDRADAEAAYAQAVMAGGWTDASLKAVWVRDHPTGRIPPGVNFPSAYVKAHITRLCQSEPPASAPAGRDGKPDYAAAQMAERKQQWQAWAEAAKGERDPATEATLEALKRGDFSGTKGEAA